MKRYFLELRYTMERKGFDQRSFAAEIQMSEQCLSNRLCRRSPWTVPEALQVCKALGEPPEAISRLFADCEVA